ncbi:PDZ/DHR/GLGF domain-containing protein [Gottschalkia acidurici 9a]|uniref:PDZ/DHR/GLGF domain-containing protein n=1 Tax=Gottschalkia acidurici (strain ATCC 7906 / DSM 604 / BCRC 14475 / CIP 104303 / KCTC 5404 / NCIMB 10678 / 9a) TaxID=1128398 RepID=K0B0J8_GOTA9|nr:PDZ/DHR/GLGF domain-containing protein [Gottschalkia acidurici]AFS79059.1 PDZ/DHR/GLGF domain-containing protein [Gottschalkia acidurici 9a]
MEQFIQLINILVLNILGCIKSEISLVVVIILFIQYKNIGKLEKKIIGINKQTTYSRVFTSIVWGILGGIIGSLLILWLGITIEKSDFSYVLIVSIILMLIHPRFICLSYSGGLISLVSIFTGYTKINVPNLMAVIAILHLVESLLILIDGSKSKIPMFIERNGTVVGGFTMTKYWAVPFTILVATSMDTSVNTLHMPTWWPLLSIDIMGNNITYFMTGIIAVLGYGDSAVTQYPEEKAKESAKALVIFSISLLILSIVANKIHGFEVIVALYAPIAHELIIHISKKKDQKGEPVFTPVDNGIRVLDVMPKSIGEKLNIKPGNILKSINGKNVYDRKDIIYVLLSEPRSIIVEYYDNKGNLIIKQHKGKKKDASSLGLLVVNKYSNLVFHLEEDRGIIQKYLKIYKLTKKLLKNNLFASL